MGFDLCQPCHERGTAGAEGRFAQGHTAQHRMELVRPRVTAMHLLRAANPDLTPDQLFWLLELALAPEQQPAEQGQQQAAEQGQPQGGGGSDDGGSREQQADSSLGQQQAHGEGLDRPIPPPRGRGPRPAPDPSAQWPSPSAP